MNQQSPDYHEWKEFAIMLMISTNFITAT